MKSAVKSNHKYLTDLLKPSNPIKTIKGIFRDLSITNTKRE